MPVNTSAIQIEFNQPPPELTRNSSKCTFEFRAEILSLSRKSLYYCRLSLFSPCSTVYISISCPYMPKLSSINCSLRRITKQCGISRHITFHCTRHTFATTLCLSQGIPLSTVSKMLGHKQITTTQIYAQTTPIMIEDAIDRVESRLDGKFAA